MIIAAHNHAAIAPTATSTTMTTAIMAAAPPLAAAAREARPPRRLRPLLCACRESPRAPKLGGDRRGALRAVLDVRREHAADDLLELGGHGGIQAGQHETARALPAREHLEHHGAQRVDVAARIGRVSGELFGRRRTAPADVERGAAPPAVKRAQPEVHELRAIFRRDHDRVGPDVAVDRCRRHAPRRARRRD